MKIRKIGTLVVTAIIALILTTIVAIGIPSYNVIVGESNNVLNEQMSQRVMCAWDVAEGLRLNSPSEDAAKEAFSKYALTRMVGTEGYGYLIDSSGKILNHPDSSMIGKNLQSIVPEAGEMINSISSFTMQDYGHAATREIEYSYKGKKKFAFYTYYKPWDMIIVLSGNHEDFTKASDKAMVVLFGVGGLVLVLASIAAFILTRKLTSPIIGLAKAMDKAEKGDLTQEVEEKSSTEIGLLEKGFNNMIKSLRTLSVRVKEATEVLGDSLRIANENASDSLEASEQIASASSEIAGANMNLAHETEKGSETMRQISEFAKGTTISTEEMRSLARETTDFVSKGAEITIELTAKTDITKSMFSNVTEKISKLEAQSEKISEVTRVIKGISDQTNLLSLNASIEAARAGEQGRGFAVVADEVRKLAERSAEETSAIAMVVKEIQKEIEDIAGYVTSTNEIMEEQAHIVDETETTFKSIADRINEMTNKIGTVSEKMYEIDEKISEGANMIESISATTQETSASSEEVSSLTEQQLANMEEVRRAMQELSSISSSLQKLIMNFKTE